MAEHQESTRLLTQRAYDLGRPESRIVVIDDDLGKSDTRVEGRSGFQRLVTEVSLDRVGVILGVEMSWLARSCKDWYQLLEMSIARSCPCVSRCGGTWPGSLPKGSE